MAKIYGKKEEIFLNIAYAVVRQRYSFSLLQMKEAKQSVMLIRTRKRIESFGC